MGHSDSENQDSGAKPGHGPALESLKDYVTWQREVRAQGETAGLPSHGPGSIVLDLTTACSFSCPHCLDARMLNTGDYLDLDTVKKSIDTLQRNGLRSVTITGGGEPSMHKNFEEILRFVKGRSLQTGIVTNGSNLDKVVGASEVLQDTDWLRVSLDAGVESTYFKSHRPRGRVRLESILAGVREIKRLNPRVRAGCSFVIVWQGITVNGYELTSNIAEMAPAVKNAREYGFDHVLFRPCVMRHEGSQMETLFDTPDPDREARITEAIENNLSAAEEVSGGDVMILKSLDLAAMLDGKVHELKVQPEVCHCQFFRTVLTPQGVFHCPALRGMEHARIGDAVGYKGKANFDFTQARLEHSIRSFNARVECGMTACIYHHTNWWIEKFIHSGEDVDRIQTAPDTDSFLHGIST